MKQLSFLAITTAVALFVGCGQSSEKKKKGEETQRTELVKVQSVQLEKIARTLEYTSTLTPFEEISLVPATPGKIDKILVQVGDAVTEGQLLVQMDPTTLNTTKIQFENLKVEMGRIELLYQSGSVSQQVYDQTKVQHDLTQTNLAFLEKNVNLKAPFNGIISGKFYENGELYNGSPNAQTGKAAIVSLVQIEKLKALVSIPETYYPLLRVGIAVDIRCDIYPDKEFKGKILRVYPTIDAASRTFQAEIEIINTQMLLRPGMFCRASIELGETMALVVPYQSALKMQGSNERYLFVVRNGEAQRITVELGKRYNEKVEILSSELYEGDLLVVTGQGRLMQGVKVEIEE